MASQRPFGRRAQRVSIVVSFTNLLPPEFTYSFKDPGLVVRDVARSEHLTIVGRMIKGVYGSPW